MTLYTIGTQMTYDEAIVTSKTPMKVGPGKWAWRTKAEAVTFIRARREWWHGWCAVYEMDIPKGQGQATRLEDDGQLHLLVHGTIVRRVWPTREDTLST